MQADESFQNRYRDLEKRMKALAESDGDIYLPNAEPESPVQYVLICMEPSLGRWARSPEHAKERVEAGFRNFLVSLETSILHFCVQRYLCQNGDRYHITDLSKGAMYVDRAGEERLKRYDRWYPLLQEELDLCAAPDAGIVAVGKIVAEQLRRRDFRRPFAEVIHYSNQAGPSRNAGVVGSEEEFDAFRTSVRLDDVIGAAEVAARTARAPDEIREEVVSLLRKRQQLSESSLKPIFNYKTKFEAERVRRSRVGAIA